jgi:hypothetical protein
VAIHAEIVQPQGMELKQWADAFVYVMSATLPLPWLQNEAGFNLWATQIAQEPQLAPFELPYPQGGAENWRSWAIGVNNALSTVAAH